MDIIASKADVIANKENENVRKPASLPDAEPGEKKEEYLLLVRENAPIESVTLLGINFSKFYMPPEASYVSNAGVYFSPRYITSMLTEKQVKALIERAREVIVHIPQKRNPVWTPGDKDQKEYFPGFSKPASEYLVIAKKNEYNPFEIKSPQIQDVSFEEQTGESFTDVLYKEQKKAKK